MPKDSIEQMRRAKVAKALAALRDPNPPPRKLGLYLVHDQRYLPHQPKLDIRTARRRVHPQ